MEEYKGYALKIFTSLLSGRFNGEEISYRYAMEVGKRRESFEEMLERVTNMLIETKQRIKEVKDTYACPVMRYDYILGIQQDYMRIIPILKCDQELFWADYLSFIGETM